MRVRHWRFRRREDRLLDIILFDSWISHLSGSDVCATRTKIPVAYSTATQHEGHASKMVVHVRAGAADREQSIFRVRRLARGRGKEEEQKEDAPQPDSLQRRTHDSTSA